MHLREHEPCPNCGNPVRKLRAAGRGTYVCERCQPRPRAPDVRKPRRRLSGGASYAAAASSFRPPRAVERDELLVAADALAVDYDLGERHHPRQTHELGATLRVLGEVDLLVGDAPLGEEGLGDAAIAAGLGRVDGDLAHDFRKYSAISGSVKTEGIVLRSIRYGEADRILHLYTPIARAPERDRQRRPEGALALRRAARTVLPPRPRPLRGPQRPADRHRRPRPSPPTRACASTAARSTAPRAPARPSRGSSTTAIRTPASITCWPTSSRCSTATRTAPAAPTPSPSA